MINCLDEYHNKGTSCLDFKSERLSHLRTFQLYAEQYKAKIIIQGNNWFNYQISLRFDAQNIQADLNVIQGRSMQGHVNAYFTTRWKGNSVYFNDEFFTAVGGVTKAFILSPSEILTNIMPIDSLTLTDVLVPAFELISLGKAVG